MRSGGCRWDGAWRRAKRRHASAGADSRRHAGAGVTGRTGRHAETPAAGGYHRHMTPVQLAAVPGTFPGTASHFLLDGPAGKLELITDAAARSGAGAGARQGVAVICHPQPQQGGTMHNKVVTMTERALRESGLDTVRFNFRGTGESTGTYDDGVGEGDDLAAVVAWVRAMRPRDALWLGGFSFGGYVAVRNAVRLRADALITIAPPVAMRPMDGIPLPQCPWLLIQGEADDVVDPKAVFAWIDTLEHPPEVVRVPEAGHFFHRRMMDLRGVVKHGVRSWLPPVRPA